MPERVSLLILCWWTGEQEEYADDNQRDADDAKGVVIGIACIKQRFTLKWLKHRARLKPGCGSFHVQG